MQIQAMVIRGQMQVSIQIQAPGRVRLWRRQRWLWLVQLLELT
jgi:hypothetical protein